MKLSGALVLLRKPEGPGDDKHILVHSGKLAAELLKPAPVVPVEANSHLRADVGQVKCVIHGYNHQEEPRKG